MSAPNVAELMTDPDVGARTILLRRPNAPTFANEGVATHTYASDVPITAIVQPPDADDLKLLPEGMSLDDVISVFCGTELRPGSDKGQESDVLVIDGATYRVFKLEDFHEHGYWHVFAQRFFA